MFRLVNVCSFDKTILLSTTACVRYGSFHDHNYLRTVMFFFIEATCVHYWKIGRACLLIRLLSSQGGPVRHRDPKSTLMRGVQRYPNQRGANGHCSTSLTRTGSAQGIEEGTNTMECCLTRHAEREFVSDRVSNVKLAGRTFFAQ